MWQVRDGFLCGSAAGRSGRMRRTAFRGPSRKRKRCKNNCPARCGMRRSEFCQSRGLSFSTLDRHLKKRRWKRRRRPVSSAGRLVKVELATNKSPTPQEPSCGLAVVLPGGRRIEVHPDFDTNAFELVRHGNNHYVAGGSSFQAPDKAANQPVCGFGSSFC